jgi:hypothetical protein
MYNDCVIGMVYYVNFSYEWRVVSVSPHLLRLMKWNKLDSLVVIFCANYGQ